MSHRTRAVGHVANDAAPPPPTANHLRTVYEWPASQIAIAAWCGALANACGVYVGQRQHKGAARDGLIADRRESGTHAALTAQPPPRAGRLGCRPRTRRR